MGDIIALMNTSVTAVVSWFTQIMDSTGAGPLYVSVMVVVLSVGILLGPLLGSSRAGLDVGSDKAAKWISDHKQDRTRTTNHIQKISYYDGKR